MLKRAFLPALAALAVLAPLGVSADTAAGAKPLRHLRYNVNVGITMSQEFREYSGPIQNAAPGSITATGSIDADVIGLAPNNILVFDVSEQTDTRKAPVVKVGVFDQGQVSFDPKDAANVTDEEQTLLTLLGRAVVANHDLAPNFEWKFTRNAPHVSDTTTFRVVSLVGDDKVNLEMDRAISTTDAQNLDISEHGKILYDFKRSVPLSAQFLQTMRTHDVNTRTKTDMSFEYRLSEDSLAKS
jgi:hypothetical protein